jgi:hypothetical protein
MISARNTRRSSTVQELTHIRIDGSPSAPLRGCTEILTRRLNVNFRDCSMTGSFGG